MVKMVNFTPIVLLVGITVAAPRFWSYHGPGDLVEKVATDEAAPLTSRSADSCPVGQQPCSGDGSLVCMSTNQFGICNFGCMIPQFVAAGTSCVNGAIGMGSSPGAAAPPPVATTVFPNSSRPVDSTTKPPVAALPAASSAANTSLAIAAPTIQVPSNPAATSSAILVNSIVPTATFATPVPARASASGGITTAPLPQTVVPAAAKSATVQTETPPALSLPTNQPSVVSSPSPAAKPQTSAGKSVTAAMIKQIMPNSAACSGSGATASQCRTADQAVTFVNAAWIKYKITSRAAQAATLAWQALESVEYKFDTNQVPGTPGQGTRNMQMPHFNSEYASSLGYDVAGAGGDVTKILALVLNDADSFASASWFVSTKCPAVLTQFDSDPEGAWTAMHSSGCIDTTMTSDRIKYWTAAKAAFGL